MASLKDIKRHIGAVRQTQKLTKAMNMVAAAKLRTIQGVTEHFQKYADEYGRLLSEIGKRSKIQAESILKPGKQSDKSLIILFTSDKGLCGSFNANIFNLVDKKILESRKEGLEPSLFVLGRKGCEYYQRRNVKLVKKVQGLSNMFSFNFASRTNEEIVRSYTSTTEDTYKEISLVYTKFISVHHHPVVSDLFLPLVPPEDLEDTPAKDASEEDKKEFLNSRLDYLIEPEPDDLFSGLIPQSLTIKLYRAYLESVTSENASRMQAMDNASRSCKDIIESLTLAYNKARQSAVTTELLDIVNGCEALNG
ncbi:MAG: ATP synthase F1 subunit gamma [Deltaproteobacteria bacterium]|jgi:F-type H+-transporting ATPase subunit gamma|nr:ATP synthase F1 subunit gamma [Deltaproteobacteria bacterium]